MTVTVNDRVKITKNKRAKSWKVLGIVLPLPLMKRDRGEMQYILANRNKNIYVYPNQILEVLV
jgi:hypothetical protein